jgi:hypothetical protein
VAEIDEKVEKGKKGQERIRYLEPIPHDSFIRHQMLKMFVDVGLEDFQAQILLSAVLHGGQIKPKTLAKDLQCNPSRLELPDGFPSLIDLKLIAMSHHRPKTVILAVSIEELLERLSTRTLKESNLLNPQIAHEILVKLDERCTGSDPHTLHGYYSELQSLARSYPSLISLLYFIFVSLWMNDASALILANLIASGGQNPKRQFYLEKIKKIRFKDLIDGSKGIKKDLVSLGYDGELLQQIIRKFTRFYQEKDIDFKLSSEHQFNTTLGTLESYLHSTSMGKKDQQRKFVNLALIKTLSQIAEHLYQTVHDFKKQYNTELHTLQMAYSNVKLIDPEIYLSSIADPSSTRRRLETDLQYAKKICLVLLHTNFVADIFLKIFDSDNTSVELNIIGAEEQKDHLTKILALHKSRIQGRRGIRAEDTITFTPSDEIPQDVLVGNSIILFYTVGSSMIIIHEEITKKNPTEINTIPVDVDFAFQNFKEIKTANLENTVFIQTLLDEEGEE